MSSIGIVEDELITAHSLELKLENLGHEVLFIESSAEKVLQGPVRDLLSKTELIFLDIKLDGEIDGVELAERVHKIEDIPVIFLTAFSNKDIVERAKKTGPYGYIVKPFSQRDLIASIEIALYKHHMEKKLRLSEERYRKVSQLTYDSCYCCRASRDGPLIIEWQTESFSEIFHTDTTTVTLAECFDALLDRRGKEAFKREEEQIHRMERTETEYTLHFPNGEMKRIRNESFPEKKDPETGEILIYGVIKDITKIYKTRQSLREYERSYRKIFSRIGIPFLEVDSQLRVLQANQAYEKMMNTNWEELIGSIPPWLKDFREKIRINETGDFLISLPIPLFGQGVKKNRQKREEYRVYFSSLFTDGFFSGSYLTVTGCSTSAEDIINSSRFLKDREETALEILEYPALIMNPENLTIGDTNTLLQSLTGYGKKELKGEKILTLMDWRELERINSFLELVEKGSKGKWMPSVILDKSGNAKQVSIFSQRVIEQEKGEPEYDSILLIIRERP